MGACLCNKVFPIGIFEHKNSKIQELEETLNQTLEIITKKIQNAPMLTLENSTIHLNVI